MSVKCDRFIVTNTKGQPARIFSPSAIKPREAQACSGVLELLSDTLVKCPNCSHTRRGTEDEIKALRKKSKATRQKPSFEVRQLWKDVDADVTQQEE